VTSKIEAGHGVGEKMKLFSLLRHVEIIVSVIGNSTEDAGVVC